MKTCYIYVLVDPRNQEVRYVGRTSQAERRLYLHKWGNSRNDEKDTWVTELQAGGYEPVMVIVEVTDDDHWKQREMHWQQHFESLGATLLSRNMRTQATILRNRQDVREKYSESFKKRWTDPAWRAKMNALHSGVVRPEGTGEKIAAGVAEAHRRKREASGGRELLEKHTPEIVGLLDPDGNPVPPFKHIRQFCEERGLCSGTLGQVIRGKRPHHKGYRMSADVPGDPSKIVR